MISCFLVLIILAIGPLVKTYTILLQHHLRFYLTRGVVVINFSLAVFMLETLKSS